ncbi:MAG: hypothetical protein BWY75_00202 [bacterium ADurb.Bin425]|nr:MAG: hypothetical protein BWY75_00202 [bacterium ADurb.Bin425]
MRSLLYAVIVKLIFIYVIFIYVIFIWFRLGGALFATHLLCVDCSCRPSSLLQTSSLYLNALFR